MESLQIERNLIEKNLSVEKTSVIAEMNTKFETVKKDAGIQVLTKTNEVNRWRIWALVAGLITLLSLAFILIQKRSTNFGPRKGDRRRKGRTGSRSQKERTSQ